MRLMLLRHAKSAKAEHGMPDRDRPLVERGHKDIHKIGGYMVHHGLVPDRVMVSSARRTRETWECISDAFSTAPSVTFEDRLYESNSQGIVSVIGGVQPSAQSLLVVGHNPGLHEVALLLIATGDVETRERLVAGLPTSGLAVIDFVQDSWKKLHPLGGRLIRFITPRMLNTAVD
jgi:phosphohistidine phosphatase